MALRRTKIRAALTRPVLVMGAERRIVFGVIGCSVLLIMGVQTIAGVITGIVLWFVGIYVGRVLAKSDPMMTDVYERHIKYQKYYPARSTPWRDR